MTDPPSRFSDALRLTLIAEFAERPEGINGTFYLRARARILLLLFTTGFQPAVAQPFRLRTQG